MFRNLPSRPQPHGIPIWNRLRRVSLIVGSLLFCVCLTLGQWTWAQGTSRPAGINRPRAVPNGGQLRVDDDLPRRDPLPKAQPLDRRQALELPAQPPGPDQPADAGWPMGIEPQKLVSPQGMSSTLNLLVLMTVLSLAPSILMMTTCFIRFTIVFGLLRQALGTQQLPPNQVLIGLSLFLTFMAMSPVWRASYEEGIRPYTEPAAGQASPSLQQTFENTVRPIRRNMAHQIEATGNSDTVWMLLDYQQPLSESDQVARPETYDDVPLTVLLPSYMLSELKTSFLIGFQIYLPFLVIDMVVATVLMSMGMMMLPPTLVSFPFKLLLFVLIDGWMLTVGMLLEGVRTLSG